MLSLKKSFKLVLTLTVGLTLILPGLSSAAPAKNQQQWIRQNSHEIKSLVSDDYRDLAFLKPLLQGKTVVSLGENFHRVAEYSSAKTRLIKYLHEELGFDVIAFESGMGDAAAAWNTRNKLSPEEMMAGSILQVWHSQETLELFKYIQQQSKGKRPLYLAGYDMQFTSYYLTNFIASGLYKIDPQRGKDFAEMEMKAITSYYGVLNKYGSFSSKNDTYNKEIKQVIDLYEPKYKETIKYIQEHRQEFASKYPDNPKMTDIIIRSLRDHINFLNMAAQQDVTRSYEFRDRLMVDNLEWQMKNLYPGKKVILWAHNDHLAKNTSQILTKENGKWVRSFTSMGEMLHKKLKDKLYVVGLYMNQGSASTISANKPFTIKPMPKGSLENLMLSSGYKNTFIDLSRQKKNSLNAWMFKPIYAAEDGMTAEFIMPNQMKFIPRDQYDGILLIDKVKSPTPVDFSKLAAPSSN
ncbi:erythromycin esterase family protein [Paenibacillus tuaregi]|uniref:erythromycin esterase family protein n=1 Tax=Paenibacillus tuaregi TaxID=1816681 RepID=UPI000838D631|nr:erythromycin esterase family protein [Paenibacillus tuaregi]